MAGGGHLGPLSYVHGYRGGSGRRKVGQDTTGEDGIEIWARDGRYELAQWRCAAGFVPKSAISDVGQRKNGRSAGKKYLRQETRLGGARWDTEWLGPIRGR